MLRGLKPVASFCVDNGPEHLIRDLRIFDRHVELDRLCKREKLAELAGRPFRRVLYALTSEDWRIDALLHHYDLGHGWSAEGERGEGLLLGYAEWEIEA